MFDWLEGLNDRQREAVEYDGGPLLVVAGAGTGKTRTLTARVARLVATGTAAERVLLLTFSRRGDLVRRQFEHVLVDEYQDTNEVQGDILFSLCGPGGNVCAVGDDAQAIYAFRAASPKNMHEFPARYPSARVVTLEQNYRSTQ